jgi:hypothetical protein
MKTTIDEWRFLTTEEGILLADVYLSNGQKAELEINPLINPKKPEEVHLEMIVFCEMSGERVVEGRGPGRWISRPPDRSCTWSSVEVPPALARQIELRLRDMLEPSAQPAQA